MTPIGHPLRDWASRHSEEIGETLIILCAIAVIVWLLGPSLTQWWRP